jgi:hypothetical protein
MSTYFPGSTCTQFGLAGPPTTTKLTPSGHLNLLNYWWANDLEADTNVPATGAWHLAVAEFDGATRRILLDGVVIGSDTPTGHNVPSPSNFRIGSTNRGEYFNGLIDEAQVYNRAMTLAEVQAIFTAGAAGLVKGARSSDPAVVPTGGFTATAYAGVASAMQPLAVFSDPGGAEALADYSALINWGDNTVPSAGTISFNAGTGVFTVQGGHPYARTGNYAVTVTIHHDAALDATVSSSAQVLAPVLHLVGFPSPTIAGTPGSLTVTVQDALGAPLGGYRGTVHFTSTDSQAGLPADYTFIAADNGMHTFSATLKTAGSQSLTATDTAPVGASGTQSGIVIIPAAAGTFAVSEFPIPTVSGAPGGLLVTGKDAFGNTATSYGGTVHFTSSDPSATLQGDYTFMAADNGEHAFFAILRTLGMQSITAQDTLTATITGMQSGIAVVPAIQVTGFSSEVTAGDTNPFTVTALDFNGNVLTSFIGTIQLTSPSAVTFTDNDGSPLIGGNNYTFTAADGGSHTFLATLYTAGTQSITATTSVAGVNVAGTQSGILVDPAAASQIVVTTPYPSPVTAGTAHTITITIEDNFGNTIPNYAGTVTVSSSDGQLTPLTYTFVPGTDHGVHTFNVALKTAGTQSIFFDDTDAFIHGQQDGIQVNAAAMAGFAVFGYPSGGSTFEFHTFTVEAVDAFGNQVTNYRGTVHLSSDDALLPGDYTFTDADAGLHVFTTAFQIAGTHYLRAVDTAMMSLFGEEDDIDVL